MQRDTFHEQPLPGWVFLEVNRYDPTRLEGLTPGGETFTATFDGDLVTLTVAGRKIERTVPKYDWLPGEHTARILQELHDELA